MNLAAHLLRPLQVGTLVALTTASMAAQARHWDPVFAQLDVTPALAYGQAVARHTGQAESLRLDLYEPNGDVAPARPAVLLVHGGGFLGGSRLDPNIVELARRLAATGYVTASADYRLVPAPHNADYQDVVNAGHDIKAAVRWLRASAQLHRIDVDRIAVIGASAGAIAAIEAFYELGEGLSGNPGWRSDVAAVVDLWGAAVDVRSIQRDEAPLMILHGTLDPILSFGFAQALADRAAAVGLDHAFHPLAGQGHAPWSVVRQSWVDNILGFLFRHLDLVEVAGLAIEPGWSSPGVVRVSVTVPRGDHWLLYNAWSRAPWAVPGLGIVQLDPATTFFIAAGGYAGPAEVGSSQHFEWIPAGLAGTAHWQGVVLRGGRFARLTNDLVTPF